MESSRTTTSLVIESISDRPVCDVHAGHQRQPARGQLRGEQRHRQHEQHPALDGGDPAQHLQVLQYVRPADVQRPPGRLGHLEHADQVAHHVRDGDRLGPGVHPARGDHGRQVLDELAGHLPGDAAVPDHDPGAQRGDRHPAPAEQPLHLAPAAQVRGQVVAVVTEPAEVDDPLEPGVGRGGGERAGGRGVPLLEVLIAERVHQVVGGRAAAQRLGHRVRIVHVALHRLAGAVGNGPGGGSWPAPRGRPWPARGRAGCR